MMLINRAGKKFLRTLVLYDFLHNVFLRRLNFKEILSRWSMESVSVPVTSDPSNFRVGKCDFVSCLFVDLLTLITRRILPGKAYMTYFKVLPGGRTVKRTVFVRLLNRQTANPTAFASKELLFNCMNDSDKSVLFEAAALSSVDDEGLLNATEVRLAPIRVYGSSKHDNLLFEHFKTTRLLHEGDVFSIENEMCKDRAYYKVISLSKIVAGGESSVIISLSCGLANSQFTNCYELAPLPHNFPSQRLSDKEFLPQSLGPAVEKASEFFLAYKLLTHGLIGSFSIAKLRALLESSFKENQPSTVKPISTAVLLVAFSDPEGMCELFVDGLRDRLASNVVPIDCAEFCPFLGGFSVSSKSLEAKVRNAFCYAASFAPCVIWLRNTNKFSVRNPDDEAVLLLDLLVQLIGSLAELSGVYGVLLTCHANRMWELPPQLSTLVHLQYTVDGLTHCDRKRFFVKRLGSYLRTADFDLEWLIDNTKDFSLPELEQLLSEAGEGALLEEKRVISKSHLSAAIDRRQRAMADSAGVPRIPDVRWEDVGGLDDVKQFISESVNVNLAQFQQQISGDEDYNVDEKRKRPLTANTWRRSGLLLYGPPGCGKTLIAKAVANQFKMTFLSVKGPELLNQYVGQSEQNLREIFLRARSASPAILFFDELDSLAGRRDSTGDSGGIMDRMVSQLLAEMDSVQNDAECLVFVMGATNRIDLLDPCLLTPGRFDKSIMVRPARDLESKRRILRPICRKLNLENGFGVDEIAEMCPTEMSGAELNAIMSAAAMHSIREAIERIEANKMMENCKKLNVDSVSDVQLIKNGIHEDDCTVTIMRSHVELAILERSKEL